MKILYLQAAAPHICISPVSWKRKEKAAKLQESVQTPDGDPTTSNLLSLSTMSYFQKHFWWVPKL
jgi:hypothetical protein